MTIIKFQKIHQDAILPNYAHEGDAGMDLFSIEDCTLKPQERRTFSLGFKAQFPSDYVAHVWDKSGIASKFGIKTMGGVIDSSYRGEYKIILLNTSNHDFKIQKGQKIAQLVFTKIGKFEIQEVDKLEDSQRGEGGFGSSGLK